MGLSTSELESSWIFSSNAPNCQYVHHVSNGKGGKGSGGSSSGGSGSGGSSSGGSGSGGSSSGGSSSGGGDSSSSNGGSSNSDSGNNGGASSNGEAEDGSNNGDDFNESENTQANDANNNDSSGNGAGNNNGQSSSSGNGQDETFEEDQVVTNEDFENVNGDEEDEYYSQNDAAEGNNGNGGEESANYSQNEGDEENNGQNDEYDNGGEEGENYSQNEGDGGNNDDGQANENYNENGQNNENNNGDGQNNGNDNGDEEDNNYYQNENGGGNNGGDANENNDVDYEGDEYDPYQDFIIEECDTYENLWLWDLSLTCESEQDLSKCECIFAEELMDLGIVTCQDAAQCPSKCRICATCFQLMGCTGTSLGPDTVQASRSAFFVLAAAAGLFICVLAFYANRHNNEDSGGSLGEYLMEGDNNEASPTMSPNEDEQVWLGPVSPPAQFEPSHLAAVEASSIFSSASSSDGLLPLPTCPIAPQLASNAAEEAKEESIWLGPVT